MRRWVSAPDPNANYFKALSQRSANTGTWFLNSDKYTDWKSEPKSFLWLHGIPGCGKTVLTAAVIQDLLRNYPAGVGVAYFYFDFNTTAKQASGNMFRSIFSQLCQQCVTFPDPIKALYEACSPPRPKRDPSSAEIVSVLQHLIRAFPGCFLVLDALDECTDRDPVLKMLNEWHSQIDNLHILFSSRKERDIELATELFLDQSSWVDLQSSVVDNDIRLYIHQRWSSSIEFKRWKSYTAVQEEVEEALMQKSHGM
jgi:Cdc6-like AAA superfamily ATPase